MKIILFILILSPTVFGGDYILYQKKTVDSNKKMVLFKEKGWVRNNNGWKNKLISDKVFSDREVLKLGHAKLIESPKTYKKPFIHLWDEKEKKIRVICMGFGTGHKGLNIKNKSDLSF